MSARYDQIGREYAATRVPDARPAAYLDPIVRANMSPFALAGEERDTGSSSPTSPQECTTWIEENVTTDSVSSWP